MDEKRLFPVSIDLLYVGMPVDYDIHDYTASRLLLRKGRNITASQIESIERINNKNNIIYVSEAMYQRMLKHSPELNIRERDELEKTTGYHAIKEETLTILQEIQSQNDTISQETLTNFSDKLSEQLEVTKPDIIVELINAMAPVDEYLQRHCVNVSLLNGLMGKWLKMPSDIVDALVLVGLLHDCGKAAIPRQIITAPRPLSVVEFEVIKMHPLHSYNMLSEFNEIIRYGARSHHEKYNENGYPDGVNGNAIPLYGRITAISDIYDAMTARRSYKGPISPFSVLSWLKELSGTDLDPALVELFVENMANECIGKAVLLSNGYVGIVHAVNHDNIEHPTVKVGKKLFQCGEKVYCQSMYYGDDV